MDNYQKFLESKAIFHPDAGIDFPKEKISRKLFQFQRDIVAWALRKGRAAIFADCGLGKTIMQLEWGRRIGGNGLILAPLAVSGQTVDEAWDKLHFKVINARQECEEESVITNYEMMHYFNPSRYKWIVLDESSILKSFDGKMRSEIISRFRPIPYKLACTATPSPNDIMELGNHSEFLGNLSRTEMLSTFFVHDGGDTNKWRLKGHAVKDFWKWVCTWAAMLRRPSDLGYSDEGFILPELRIHEIVVDCDDKAIMEDDVSGQWTMFPGDARTLAERRAARSQSIDERAAKVKEIYEQAPNESLLVWCNLNTESKAATKLIPDAVEITGSDSREKKEESILGFAAGSVKHVVSKPAILGFGLNLQRCHRVVFYGLSDSYESYYQAVRRVWRFGQKQPVDCYIVTSSLEGEVVKNIHRKEAEAGKMAEEMVANMSEFNKAELKSQRRKGDVYETALVVGAQWEMCLGDTCEIIDRWKADSVGYIISSWPFASLYTYSASERDAGNCRTHAEFWEHMDFMIPNLLRILKPGRLMSVHCMNLPTSKERDGVIGLTDFRGDVIRACQKHGFIYHSEVAIWKDPVTAMQRTKAIGLLHKQIKKDSCRSRQGIPDYLVTFRKPGDNPEPVDGKFDRYIGEEGTGPKHTPEDAIQSAQEAERFSIEVWQRYASPVWMDINPSDTLQKQSAREDEDERHICPLQLQVIERGIELWSNPGDVVFDPFTGIGSTGYKALKMGRKFIGCELKKSYFQQACGNLKAAEVQQESLFTDAHEFQATEPAIIPQDVLDEIRKPEVCSHEHANIDGQCYNCGADVSGIHQ